MAVRMDDVAARRGELERLVGQLNRVLEPGLAERLRSAEWYLTGVKVGLESLDAFSRIAEMVYREANAQSEGARRVANMRKVHAALTEFARTGQTIQRRVAIMLEVRQPLDMLVREFEGSRGDAGGAAELRQRRNIIAELASDVRLNLLRKPSLRKMREALGELLRLELVFLPGMKRREIEKFRRNFVAFAESFGFADPKALRSRKTVKERIALVDKELRRAERWLGELHRAIYRERFEKTATGDVDRDLSPDKLVPVLHNIAKDGFEFLDRAHSAYLHALQLAGMDVTLFHQAADLGLAIANAEAAAAAGG